MSKYLIKLNLEATNNIFKKFCDTPESDLTHNEIIHIIESLKCIFPELQKIKFGFFGFCDYREPKKCINMYIGEDTESEIQEEYTFSLYRDGTSAYFSKN